MKLNNKGFSLVELLAVVVILGILVVFMYPSVNKFINDNAEENYKKLITTVETAAKMYITDHKYKIVLDGNNIVSINGQEITDGNIPISILVSEGNIKTTKENMIINPKNKEECLDMNVSYINVLYDSETKEFKYGYSDADSPEEKAKKLKFEWVDKKTDRNRCIANVSLVKYNINLGVILFFLHIQLFYLLFYDAFLHLKMEY